MPKINIAALTPQISSPRQPMNPEAAGFWMRYFKPVCYSVVRFPENVVGAGSAC
jgi:hypothetical protein